MAQKWENNDSARTMTRKFNETVEQINGYEKTNRQTEQTAQEIRELLETKVTRETAKKDLNLDNVDNTSDMDKPLSNPQARALEFATENMLVSQGIGVTIDGPDPGLIVKLHVDNNKLIITTDASEVAERVQVYVKNSKLVLISIGGKKSWL